MADTTYYLNPSDNLLYGTYSGGTYSDPVSKSNLISKFNANELIVSFGSITFRPTSLVANEKQAFIGYNINGATKIIDGGN